MLSLYIVRHGETEWNREKRMQGRLDSNLTKKGKRDAFLLGKRLRDIDFQRIISSPSKRTLETAKIINGDRPTSIDTDERLLEIHLGDWQGKTEEEIKKLFPAQFHCYWHQPAVYDNLHGENFFDVMARASAFLTALKRAVPSGNVLIVTHGVVINTLYLLCRDAPVEKIWQTPLIQGTGLTIINIHNNGEKDLILEGCMAHTEQ